MRFISLLSMHRVVGVVYPMFWNVHDSISVHVAWPSFARFIFSGCQAEQLLSANMTFTRGLDFSIDSKKEDELTVQYILYT